MWTVFTTKNIFKYVFSDLTHFNSNIYEDKILLSDDPDDKRLFRLTLCQDCTRRSLKCPTCKLNNSEASLQQLRELELVHRHIEIVKNGTDNEGNQKYFVKVTYPVLGDVKTLYAPKLSNSEIAKKKSIALFNKLRKLELVEAFDLEIQKGIKDGHIRFLSAKEQEEVLSGPHCFSGLNYSLKPDSPANLFVQFVIPAFTMFHPV